MSKNKFYDFFIFNKSGICILEKQLKILFRNQKEYNNYKLNIKNIAHTLLINLEKNKSNSHYNENDNEKLNINKTNIFENMLIFKSIQNEKIKILFLIINNNFILVGTYPKYSSTQFQSLLLSHIFIALINFKGDIFSTMKILNEYQEYDYINFINLKSFYNQKLDSISKNANDILEILIFEKYFLESLIIHFSNVFYTMFKKENLNLKQTKFKNLYLLDINNFTVLLDMLKIQGEISSKKNKKYYKFEKLFREIKYHSKNLYNEYIKENEMTFTTIDSEFRFVKFECTSTYPRLLFIIKFIPVLKGIAIIHIYSQKKVSRKKEDHIQIEQGLNCKEYDLLFGSFIRGNSNFEFRYSAPKKLKYIEKFIEEFYITKRNVMGIFCLNNSEKKFKYVNYNIINIINTSKISNILDIDQIFKDFDKKIEEKYNLEQEKKEENKNNNNIDKNSHENIYDDNDKEMKSLNNILQINKESIYNIILNEKNKYDINFENKSLFSKDNIKDENKDENNNKNNDINNNDTDNNLNINDLISNSERKSIIKNDDKSLSLTNSKGYVYKNNNSISKNSKYDKFSMVSEVKMDENFDLKVININHVQKDKEDTKEIISQKSSSIGEELQLNEILDLISTNASKKNNYYNNEKSKIIEELKKIELTNKDINTSKLIQNSIIKKKRIKIIKSDKNNDPGSGTSRSSLIKY